MLISRVIISKDVTFVLVAVNRGTERSQTNTRRYSVRNWDPFICILITITVVGLLNIPLEMWKVVITAPVILCTLAVYKQKTVEGDGGNRSSSIEWETKSQVDEQRNKCSLESAQQMFLLLRPLVYPACPRPYFFLAAVTGSGIDSRYE